MDADAKLKSPPWHPLTFGAVAALARASLLRLLTVALVVGSILAMSVAWLFYAAWEPSVREAIAQLPENGAIRNGQLEWMGPAPVRLAGGVFVSFVIDPAATGELGSVGDLQWEFCKTELRLRSLLGRVALKYPAGWTLALNRTELEPWWGAWKPAVVAGLAVAVILLLWIAWIMLAALYLLPARVIAFIADRDLSMACAWRLGLASLMPGALLMSVALVAYSFHRINFVQLLFGVVLHLAIGWIFVLISPLRLPKHTGESPRSASRNPFGKPRTRLTADD